jgi:endonuclease/exonuclease/phosphatase family metal-dependent hydrolase
MTYRLRAGLAALAACLVTTAGFAALPDEASAAVGLKALQWNIHKARRTDGTVDVDLVVSWLVRLDADVVSLNEVKPASLAEAIRSKLSARTGRTWASYWVSESPASTTVQGVQILTRWKMSETARKHVQLSGYESRVHVKATLTHPTDPTRKVTVVATHLDHESSAARQTQARDLVKWAGQFAEPRIIMGDFNALPKYAEIASIMRERYQDTWAEAVAAGKHLTFAGNAEGRTRRKRIDYAFVSKGATRLTLSTARVPDTRNFATACSQVIHRLDPDDPACASSYPEDWRVRPTDHNALLISLVLS